MSLSDIGPYISVVAGLFLGWLTHKRANRVHKDTLVIDQQKLVRDTYEQIMKRLNAEMNRRTQAYDSERLAWERREEDLKEQVDNLRELIIQLEREVRRLRDRELKTEVVTKFHVEDDHRHAERREEPRIPEEDVTGDASY